jgi:hypothetical protein
MFRIAGLALLCIITLNGALADDADALGSLKKESTGIASINVANKLVARLAKIANGNIAHLSAKDFVLVADTFGNIVSQTRELGGSMADFDSLIDHGIGLRKRCRDKIRNLESSTNESEVGLEKLYRSDIWHDINYSLSALGYWQGWALLGIAHSKEGERDQISWLNKAESSFQKSSVRILYPGIVYGSWLGMAYVSKARGDEILAEKRYRRLVQALVSDPDNPVRKIAETELTVLAIRRGELSPVSEMKDAPLIPSRANVYLEEAFALLEKHRKTGTGAIGAAARLKQLIADGYLNNSLLGRIMSYRDEIAGQDIGLLSLYVDVEFAYGYQRYNTVVLKYREFEKSGGLDMLINFRTLQYHYTVALLKILQYHDALAMADYLRLQSDLPQPVNAALPKLSFLIAQALHEQKGSNRNRVRLLNAAEYFLTKSADDADIGSAHLILGQLSFNPEKAKHHLAIAKQDTKLKGSINLAQLKRSITAFNKAVESGSGPQRRREADQVLNRLKELPRHISKKLWVRAVTLQMRTVVERDTKPILSEIDRIYSSAEQDKNIQLDASVKQVLLWAKLRAMDKHSQQQLLSFIGSMAAGSGTVSDVDSADLREVYRFLIEKERFGQFVQLSELTDAFYPALAGQTQDQRQLRLLQIRVMTAIGQSDKAFELAKGMTREFANSGDAWMAYAKTAEATGQTFTAERAWAKITGAQPDGAPRWREAMAHRIELLDKLGDRKEDLCNALDAAFRYRHLGSKAEQKALNESRELSECG